MSITGFNIDGKTEKVDYNSLDNLPDIPAGEEWELINSSDDVELRSVSINNDGKYSRFIIILSGKAKTTASKWKLVTNGSITTYLGGTIPTHAYGGGTYFFVELHKNAPALFSCSASTNAGSGSGALKQAYLGNELSDSVTTFGLIPNDSSLEYDSLSIKVWGAKA